MGGIKRERKVKHRDPKADPRPRASGERDERLAEGKARLDSQGSEAGERGEGLGRRPA